MNPLSLKYYVYASESKVTVLISQLPPEERTSIVAELGFDLKLLQGQIRTE